MTPGLALFYGGMVRAKNVLAMLMQNFFCLGLISVLWAVCMYSLAFHGTGKWIGNFDLAFLDHANTVAGDGLRAAADPAAVVLGVPADVRGHHARAHHRRDRRPHEVLARGSGSSGCGRSRVHAGRALGVLARRVGCSAAARSTSPAAPSCTSTPASPRSPRCWCSAVGAGGPTTRSPPHSLPLTLLGTGILWFGWFGFNAGSALAANGIAAQAFMNTHIAAAAAMLGWLLFERIRGGHATTLGAASGAVAGLVAITPCAGFVGAHGVDRDRVHRRRDLLLRGEREVQASATTTRSTSSACTSSAASSARCCSGCSPTARSIPRSCTRACSSNGSWELMGDQLIAVGATLVWSGVLTFVILKVLHLVIPGGLRVSEEDEETGLDLTQHSEMGYSLDRV